jgi:transposase
VLGLDEPRAPSTLRPRVIDPYRPFIDEQLRRYPKLLATRLYDMVCARGFAGSVRTVREHVAIVRPRPPREAYLVTETLPGEVAQVDWAHVGEIPMSQGSCRLSRHD